MKVLGLLICLLFSGILQAQEVKIASQQQLPNSHPRYLTDSNGKSETLNLIEKETESVQSAPTNAEAIKKSIAEYSMLNRRQKRTLLEYLIKNIIVDGSRITVNLRLKK